MDEVGQVLVAIGPWLYEVQKGRDCCKCAFRSCVSDPCWVYCMDFFQGDSHLVRLDAPRSHKVLDFLEAQSQQERGKVLRVSAPLRETSQKEGK